MLYLLLAIASSTLISFLMRLCEKHLKNQMSMFMANYAICILLSLYYQGSLSSGFPGEGAAFTLPAGIITGFLYLASFVLMKYNMKHNGLVLTSTFMRLGVLIPTIMAVVVFREAPGITQIFGIVLALTSIILINFEKDALREGNKKLWLLATLICGGTGDAMSNVFEQLGNPNAKDVFLFTTFFTAFLLAMLLAFLSKKRIAPRDLLIGILIGIPNYYSARFMLLALGNVSAVLAYPIYSVGTIICTALLGIIFFREQVSKKKGIAPGLILLALVFLN